MKLTIRIIDQNKNDAKCTALRDAFSHTLKDLIAQCPRGTLPASKTKCLQSIKYTNRWNDPLFKQVLDTIAQHVPDDVLVRVILANSNAWRFFEVEGLAV